MKITIKRQEGDKKKINKWPIIAVFLFVMALALSYAISTSVIYKSSISQASTLDFECSAYASQLTSEFAQNSTACNQVAANGTNLYNGTCGAVFYCQYSTSCAYQKPAGPNILSCLCDGLKSNQVITTGLCLKRVES